MKAVDCITHTTLQFEPHLAKTTTHKLPAEAQRSFRGVVKLRYGLRFQLAS